MLAIYMIVQKYVEVMQKKIIEGHVMMILPMIVELIVMENLGEMQLKMIAVYVREMGHLVMIVMV